MEAAADGTCLIPAGAVDTDCKCLFEREEALRDDSLQQQQKKRREKKIVKIKRGNARREDGAVRYLKCNKTAES